MKQEKIAVIAGGTSGVGKQTAFDLARMNYKIIITGTNFIKAQQGRILMVGALPRVINHTFVHLPHFEIQAQKSYNSFDPVHEGLICRVLLTLELAKRLKKTPITVNIFHPGYITDSNYGSECNPFLKILGRILGQFSKKNPPIGAQLANNESLSKISGKLFNEKGKIISLSKHYTGALSNKLWEISQGI
ncbi:MAG TPA: hypothetical protein DEP42_03485 [Ruminococcaceae bacterium]|nr:hypothetical protein [Oscillospiraceae bacterium]